MRCSFVYNVRIDIINKYKNNKKNNIKIRLCDIIV